MTSDDGVQWNQIYGRPIKYRGALHVPPEQLTEVLTGGLAKPHLRRSGHSGLDLQGGVSECVTPRGSRVGLELAEASSGLYLLCLPHRLHDGQLPASWPSPCMKSSDLNLQQLLIQNMRGGG